MAGRRKRSRRSIVCLIGSGRHDEGYRRAYLEETIAGKIVLSMAFGMDGKRYEVAAEKAEQLEALHREKITLADEVLVINTGGYIGASTSAEIMYAIALGKRLRWTECPPLNFFVEQGLLPE